jgi:hypothetical protein
MNSCTVAVSWLFQYRCSVEALQSCTVNNCIVSVQLPWSWWVHPHLKLDPTQSETLCFSAVCCSLVSQNHSSLIFKIDPYAQCVPHLGRPLFGPENGPIIGVQCCPQIRVSVLRFSASPFCIFHFHNRSLVSITNTWCREMWGDVGSSIAWAMVVHLQLRIC